VWLVDMDARVRGGSATTVRDEIDRLEAIPGKGDPKAALARAAVVVRSAGLDARQVALVTDGQRTEWQDPGSIPDAQVLLYATPGAPPPNRAVTLAEARPVRWTPRGAVATRFLSKDSTTFRMTLGGRTFARGTAAPNEEVVVRAAPPERGWVAGTVELEPDELAGDNIRHFAVWIGPAPGVSVSPGAGQFVKEAVDVLRTSGRIVQGQDIAVVGGDELATLPAVIIAPTDPVRVGAANRALERAGIPWRFGARHGEESAARGTGFDGVTINAHYDIIAGAGAAAETLAVVGRDAWIVAGPRYVIVGSPLVPDATNLPVRATFVPWLGSILTERLVGEPGQTIDASPGARLARPRWADAMESGDGHRTALGEFLDAPSRAGTYFLTRGERRVGAVVVNAPADESILDRYTADELKSRLHTERTVVASDAASWATLAFRAAARRSLVQPALMIALVLLLIEAFVIRSRVRGLA
jgi:hypothetical protein